MQACFLADELKYLGFKYASQAGISISIEDLKIPFVKNLMIRRAEREIIDAEKIYLKGKVTDVERFQKIIDTWSLTSESLKDQIIYYFKNYDPLNSIYIMAFSGARGNLSQVRQLVGMRGLMSDPSGEIMKLPIKKNFREGLTITDYLMSGYGARKGIVDTALKTANSGYLTRRLIDVAQDILIREKDCLTTHSFLLSVSKDFQNIDNLVYNNLIGRLINKPIFVNKTKNLLSKSNTQVTPNLIKKFKEKQIKRFYIRSPLTCNLYRAICQKCYGWDLANENLVDIGEAVGILAGQSIGEPGTQLTMRTFHTGGIFTSEARQQIISPLNGIIKFYKTLKTVVLRTNRGEDVLIAKSSGSLILVPEDKTKKLVKIEILRNTILFPKNNQYISKDGVIGELINLNKQVKAEIKPILSNTCGEIFMPHLKRNINILNNNRLLWILSGQLYNSPNNSFINFYSDYKLNKHSFIFRTKIINHNIGSIKFINRKKNLYQQIIKIISNKYSLAQSTIQILKQPIKHTNYLLNLGHLKYVVNIKLQGSKLYVQLTRNKQFAILVTNSFQTLTGGRLYYDYGNLVKFNKINKVILYYSQINQKKKYNSIVKHRTVIWLEEEIYKVNCEQDTLFVEHGDFISRGFEIIPGVFSKTSGIIVVYKKNNIIQTIAIKSGLVYEGKKFKNTAKKLYYPGEVIFSNIPITKLSFCEHIIGTLAEQVLIRQIEIYEFPHSNRKFYNDNDNYNYKNNNASNFRSQFNLIYLYKYKSNQIIKSTKNVHLIINTLVSESKKLLNNNISIELSSNKITNSVDLQVTEELQLNSHIQPYLKYKNLQPCLLVKLNQFIDSYTILGYLESVTLNSLEIVKFKTKNQESKQILLISNNDCLRVKKNRFPSKKLNDFIINSSNVDETGKIIIENKTFLTLQKGKPYFFPNCKNNNLTSKTDLQYKLISPLRIQNRFKTNKYIALHYYDTMKFYMRKKYNLNYFLKFNSTIQLEFSKLFLKKNGKFYSSLIPKFLKKFSVSNDQSNYKLDQIIQSNNLRKRSTRDQTLLIKSSNPIKNKYTKPKYHLTLIKFVEYPFTRSTKSISLYSITEDYFEQEVNSIFCKNSEFIETGATIGLLNLEKEITGDIVQGLPRIEEILEARKKNLIIKRIPTSKKRGLLVQRTTLDPNFEFRKLGTAIKENEKVNPHKLLKVYFNYYGLIKPFICDRTAVIKYNRLINNYEGSYKSFKKVQSFILNSVQSVYQSQGVTINNKHLEIIIKQMTTKVLITYEGNTPLLRREVIDLYHIHYINQIIQKQGKQLACYVPLLLGITKAALNNPSFISAASFQETTRVLTKAAIEGRIDWLRGLKENIIIGHLIPAGTGSQNYRNCFQRDDSLNKTIQTSFGNITNLKQNL